MWDKITVRLYAFLYVGEYRKRVMSLFSEVISVLLILETVLKVLAGFKLNTIDILALIVCTSLLLYLLIDKKGRGKAMKGNIYELELAGKIEEGVEYRCPICFRTIDFDRDDDTEYYAIDDEIFHIDCVSDLKEAFGVKFIRNCCLQEFLEWYFNCTFRNFALEGKITDIALSNSANVIEFLEDIDDEDFIKWCKNEKKI